jgi:hypothetical protein
MQLIDGVADADVLANRLAVDRRERLVVEPLLPGHLGCVSLCDRGEIGHWGNGAETDRGAGRVDQLDVATGVDARLRLGQARTSEDSDDHGE